MDLIQKGPAWLEAKRIAHRAVEVTVRRGGLSFVAPATKGLSQSMSETAEGVIVNERAEDYIISVVDYDFGSGPVIPEIGDLIFDSSSGTEVRMEVMPMAMDIEKRYTDSYRIAWRIHTKETGHV